MGLAFFTAGYRGWHWVWWSYQNDQQTSPRVVLLYPLLDVANSAGDGMAGGEAVGGGGAKGRKEGRPGEGSFLWHKGMFQQSL